jgi:unsaturated rhamnogalacturonyl hydrolase
MRSSLSQQWPLLALFMVLIPHGTRVCGQPPGDIDADNVITACDAVALLTCLSDPPGADPSTCRVAFDFNGDEDVDLHDVAQFQPLLTSAQRLLDLPDRYSITESAMSVARHWIDGNPHPGNPGWARATCFEGIVGFYHQFREPELYNYAVQWSENNGWDLWGGTTTRNADNQTAGQVYLELYQYDSDPNRIAVIKAAIDNMVNSPQSDDWWWIDAIQMALPSFAKLGELYADDAYYNKGWDLFNHTYSIEGNNGLYSDNGIHAEGDYLWWRDAAFQPPTTSPNGMRVYWSRGNGWVFAGMARTLSHMTPADPHYQDYLQVFLQMADSLKQRQLPSGFWPVNLDDPNHAQAVNPSFTDSPETSGTSFFTYGLAWGIRNGHLAAAEFGPTVVAAWNALSTQSVQTGGRLGWCQNVGIGPESSQPFGPYSTTDFGVGAFLLAASEVTQIACGPMPAPGDIVLPYSEGWWCQSGFVDGNHALGDENTGFVTIDYDIIALSTTGVDALVAYADSDTSVNAYGDSFAMVRMYYGAFDAYNFNDYQADAAVPFVPGELYHVRAEIDLNTATYDVWITPPGQPEVQLADDYWYRWTAGPADDVGQVTLISARNPGDAVVYNHTVSTR